MGGGGSKQGAADAHREDSAESLNVEDAHPTGKMTGQSAQFATSSPFQLLFASQTRRTHSHPHASISMPTFRWRNAHLSMAQCPHLVLATRMRACAE